MLVRPGVPFVIINSLCGSLAAYGLAGLRYTASAVIFNSLITALQSLISIQLQVLLPGAAMDWRAGQGQCIRCIVALLKSLGFGSRADMGALAASGGSFCGCNAAMRPVHALPHSVGDAQFAVFKPHVCSATCKGREPSPASLPSLVNVACAIHSLGQSLQVPHLMLTPELQARMWIGVCVSLTHNKDSGHTLAIGHVASRQPCC